MAERQWRWAGARDAAEMRGFIMAQLRRRVGMAAVQAMARHRLSRMAFIGVARADLVAWRERRAAVAAAGGGRPRGERDYDPSDFYMMQARAGVAA